MDRIRTKFIIAVTSRLAAAADTNAKMELIEELSENLYQRYLDLVGSGMGEEDAYAKALEDLGDVDELLEYLRSLGPDGELPGQDASGFNKSFDEFMHSAEDIVRETISQTKDAVDQAKIIVQDVAKKLHEKYPHGFEGGIQLHFGDGDGDHGERPEGEGCEQPESGQRDVVYGFGYDKRKGGFFTQWGEYKGEYKGECVDGSTILSEGLRGLDVKLHNGDVTIHLLDDPQAPVSLEGDTDKLEVRRSESGVLSIRQGNTASSSFFFLRGLAAADVELYLPRRAWEFIQVSTVNGDVTVDEGLCADRFTAKTTSGDVELSGAACSELLLRSVSGDLDCTGGSGSVQAETMSGDVTLDGGFSAVRASSMSGELEITGSAETIRCSSASGDITVDTSAMPLELELSSKSGDCEVSLPGGEGFSLRFETVSGELESDFPLVGPLGAKSGEAIYLDGGDRSFHISSVSGDISLHMC